MATTTPNYAVDYDDKRLTDIKAEEQTVIQDNKDMYGEMVGDIETQYKGVADQVQKNAETMIQTQNENTDFQVKLIEQQKEQAQNDYIKEQSASYVDYQKQVNQYGVNAEQMAMQGLSNSGYSESSKVAMYNQYQNRVAVARETLSKVQMNYDNNIQQAILQNNSTIAQIQSEASLKQAEILLESFNMKNSLLQQQADRELQIKSMYQDKWQSELSQINTENALAEQVRQAQIEQENWEKQYKLAQEEAQREAEKHKQDMDLAERQMKLLEDEAKAKLTQIKDTTSGNTTSGGNSGNSATVKDGNSNANTSTGNSNKNSVATTQKSDYYISGKTQPQYYNDSKLSKSKVTVGDVPELSALTQAGIKKTQNIWVNSKGDYVVYDNNGNYFEVTEYMTFSNGYQPKYVNGQKLNAVIKISEWKGSASAKKQLGVPETQNIWKAGNQYYVWDGKTKQYKDVTNLIANTANSTKYT